MSEHPSKESTVVEETIEGTLFAMLPQTKMSGGDIVDLNPKASAIRRPSLHSIIGPIPCSQGPSTGSLGLPITLRNVYVVGAKDTTTGAFKTFVLKKRHTCGGIMDLKEGIFLLILLISSKSAYASTDLKGENPITEGKGGEPEQLCSVCEVFTAQATTFLNENKTRSEILDILHHACSQLHSLELKCLILVDYYSALFFASIGKIRPEEFCGRVGLCEAASVSIAKNNEKCTLCHRVVVEILLKIKNPDAQLEILQMLFKKCDKMKNYAHECKWLVMHYGPFILTKGEKFLETNDVCASILACSSKHGEANIAGSALPGSSIYDT